MKKTYHVSITQIIEGNFMAENETDAIKNALQAFKGSPRTVTCTQAAPCELDGECPWPGKSCHSCASDFEAEKI